MKKINYEEALKSWGFYPRHYQKTLKELKLSHNVLSFIHNYIENYSSHCRGIVFEGSPRKSHYVMAYIVRELLIRNKLKNRVSIIDIPTHLSVNNKLDPSERTEVITKSIEDVVNSDIVIFQEMGLGKWKDYQRAELYTLIYKRYQLEKPFFCTSTVDEKILEEYVGESIFFRLVDSCDFIGLGI